MLDYTGTYSQYDMYDRQDYARRLLDSNSDIRHVVIGYLDSDHTEIPTFIVFDDEDEWNAWVNLYQMVGGYIDARHAR